MDPRAAIPARLREVTEGLGESLAGAEPIVAFREAKARLDADPHARELLERLAETDADLRRRQADGTLTKADIDRAREVHVEASSDPSIGDLVAAQQAAVAYLPEVNLLISDLLGWDFAAMAAAPANC